MIANEGKFCSFCGKPVMQPTQPLPPPPPFASPPPQSFMPPQSFAPPPPRPQPFVPPPPPPRPQPQSFTLPPPPRPQPVFDAAETIAAQPLPPQDKVAPPGEAEIDIYPSLLRLACPECGAPDWTPLGEKGAAGKAFGAAAFGAIGSLVINSSAKKDYFTQPLQYKCNRCKTKFVSPPLPAAPDEVLPAPCTVLFTRLSSAVGMAVSQFVYLNGIKIAPVKNGSTIEFTTQLKDNMIFVADHTGMTFRMICRFPAVPGGCVEIGFRRKFEYVRSTGIGASDSITAYAGKSDTGIEAPDIVSEAQPQPPSKQIAGEIAPQSEGTLQQTREQPARPQYYPLQGHAHPEDGELDGEPTVKRAAWVFGAGMLLTLLSIMIIHIPSRVLGFYCYYILTPILPVVLGFGFCLANKESVKCKVFGSAGLLLFSFLFTLASNMSMLLIQRGQVPPLGYVFSYPPFWRTFEIALIHNGLLAAIAVCGGVWLRDKLKFPLLALVAAAATLIVSLVADWRTLQIALSRPMFSGQAAQIIISLVVNAGFFMLAALLARMTTGFRSGRIRISGGARAWCIIVSCMTGLSLIVNFAIGDSPTVFQSILIIPIVIGMIMLSANRRFGFTLALLGAGMSVMYALMRIISFTPYSAATYAGYVFGGVVNPIITWFAIAGAWRGRPSRSAYNAPSYNTGPYGAATSYVPPGGTMTYASPPHSTPHSPPPYGAPGYYAPQYGAAVYGKPEKSKLPAVFPVFTIIGAIFGLILFFAGLAAIIADGFYIEPFVFGVIAGGALSAVEILATVLYFKRRGKTGRALQIVGLCIGALVTLGGLIGLISIMV